MGGVVWTEERVLAACRVVLEEHGPDVGLRRACRIVGVSASAIQTRVGGWLEVKRRLGFPVERQGPAVHRMHSREGLVARLLELSGRLGPDITLADFCRETGIGPGTVRIYCENWSVLRRMAGFSRRRKRRPHVPDALLFADVTRVRLLLGGREPTMREYGRLGCYCGETLVRRFGPGWQRVMSWYWRFRREFLDDCGDRETADRKVAEWISELRPRVPREQPGGEGVGG